MIELPICNVFDYIEKVDNSIEDKGFDIQNQINNIIALQISRYLIWHIGGNRPFDQYIGDHLGSMIIQEIRKLKEDFNYEYIDKNSNW